MTGMANVKLWEVYQATPKLKQRTVMVGYWRDSFSSSSFESLSNSSLWPENNGRKYEKKGSNHGDNKVSYFFPSANIAPRRNDLTGLHIRCLTETVRSRGDYWYVYLFVGLFVHYRRKRIFPKVLFSVASVILFNFFFFSVCYHDNS